MVGGNLVAIRRGCVARRSRGRARGVRRARGLGPRTREGRLDWPRMAGGAWRPRAEPVPTGDLPRGVCPRRRTRAHESPRRRAGRADPSPFGTAAQKQRLLPNIVAVEELWCQGYSEPGAGSDLANVATRARRRRRTLADRRPEGVDLAGPRGRLVFRLARTEPGSRASRLSYLLVPMAQAAVRVRPIQTDRHHGVQRGVLQRR